jgi:PKD repeat protein
MNDGAFIDILSGTASPLLPLNVGTNLIKVKVTAQDLTTTKIYTAAVTRTQGGNQPPVANAGGDRSAYVGERITLNGSASDPDGDAIGGWAWQAAVIPTDADWSLSPNYAAAPTFEANTAGDYIVALLVVDSRGGLSAPDYATIHVVTNQPPVAVATADKTTITVGDTVCFDGSQSSDPEGRPLSFIWNFPDGTPPVFNQMSVCHVFPVAGTFDVGLQVTDERAAYDFYFITITVLPPLPKLRIEMPDPTTVLLAWPAAATGYSLEQNADLSPGNWLPVTTPPVVVGEEHQVTLPATPPRNFFRLRKP